MTKIDTLLLSGVLVSVFRDKSTWQRAHRTAGDISFSFSLPHSLASSNCQSTKELLLHLTLRLWKVTFAAGMKSGLRVGSLCFTALLLWGSFCCRHWFPEEEKNRASSISQDQHPAHCTKKDEPLCPTISVSFLHPVLLNFQNQVSSSLFPER